MIFVVVFGAMKSSDAYRIAASRARNDERVVRAIGKPMSEGLFVSGHTNVNGGSGQADLEIPISGPKGKARIYAVATKSAGEWVYSKLVVRVESTGETIDLNEESAP